ncbi:MAG: hypothetical protein J6W06_07855 [Bacteroidales bacterium]|jgi:hypothetical protein|nr:hypothetical protein [Bacteroidales bacterium]
MQKILKYRISDDKDFVREIELKDDSTFKDLHVAIQKNCKYDPSLITMFYIADENWEPSDEPEKTILLERIDEKTQSDCLLMEDTPLNYTKPEKGMKYQYVYDLLSENYFYVEIIDIRNYTKKDEKTKFPKCTFAEGIPPQQITIDDIEEEFDEQSALEDFDELEEDVENPYYDNEFEDGYDEFGGGYDDGYDY